MIAGAQSWRLLPLPAAARALAWCGLAGLCVALAPGFNRRGRLWPVALICGALCAGGFLLAATVAMRVTGRVSIEMGIAVSAALAAGALVFLLRAVRIRQMQLAPDLMVPKHLPGDTTTLPQPAGGSVVRGSTPGR
jgi:hypothetical protein